MLGPRFPIRASAAGLVAVLLTSPSYRPLAAASAPTADVKTSIMPNPDLLDDEAPVETQVREAERKEMVRPVPKDFKPEDVARKLRLTLVARDKSIKAGQTFWYRLEFQNVGREPVEFFEHHSFLKDGMSFEDGTMEFHVGLPDGSRRLMPLGVLADELTIGGRPGGAIDIPGSEKMTKKQLQDYVRLDSVRRHADRGLDVILAPGETLVSRPWRWLGITENFERFRRGEKDIWPRPKGTYRELWTDFDFKKPGRYVIQAEYNDEPPPPPDEAFIRSMEEEGRRRADVLSTARRFAARHLGRIHSNSIQIEVVQ